MKFSRLWLPLSFSLYVLVVVSDCGLIRPGSEGKRTLNLRASVELPPSAEGKSGADGRVIENPCESGTISARALLLTGNSESEELLGEGPLEAINCDELANNAWQVEFSGSLELVTDLSIADDCRLIIEIYTQREDIANTVWEGNVDFQDLGIELDVRRLSIGAWSNPDCLDEGEDCEASEADFCLQMTSPTDSLAYGCVYYVALPIGERDTPVNTTVHFDKADYSLSWSYVRVDTLQPDVETVAVDLSGLVRPGLSHRGEAFLGMIAFDTPDVLTIEKESITIVAEPIPRDYITGELAIQVETEADVTIARGVLSLAINPSPTRR